MSYQRRQGDSTGPSVAVVDTEVPDDTWQAIGLDSVAAGFSAHQSDKQARRWGASASTTALWSGLPADPVGRPAWRAGERSAETPPRQPSRRVPPRDIILIGRAAPSGAEDAFPRSGGKPSRKNWRELFFLGLLAITLLGAYQSGRLTGVQRVIVVPAPESRHSVIT